MTSSHPALWAVLGRGRLVATLYLRLEEGRGEEGSGPPRIEEGRTFRKHTVCKNRGAVFHGELTRGFRARALTRDAHVRTKPGRVFKIFLPFVVKSFPL